MLTLSLVMIPCGPLSSTAVDTTVVRRRNAWTRSVQSIAARFHPRRATCARLQHLVGLRVSTATGLTHDEGLGAECYGRTGEVPHRRTSDERRRACDGMMGVLSLAFILIPFLPGVRDLPRRIPIYKLIWREHYRSTPDQLLSL